MKQHKIYKIEVLSGGTWFTSTTFQVLEKTFTIEKTPEEQGTVQVFKGSLLECEAYIRLLKVGYIE